MNNETCIACEEGEYSSFTGIILWGDNEGIVENANFYLEVKSNFKFVIFHSGVWQNGFLCYGRWFNGTWVNGTWGDGIWYDGIWKDGIWKDGIWESGSWKDGIWENGIWEDGVWKNGVWEKGIWKRGFDNSRKLHSNSPNFWKGQK